MKIRRKWGQCAVCELTTWLYQVEGLTVRGRCLQCWMDAADAGIISWRLYERIRGRALKGLSSLV